MKKFRVLIAPCSDNEDEFDNASSFEEAVEISKIHPEGVSIHEFDTEPERKAFILGYKTGIGWFGNGFFIVEDKPFFRKMTLDELENFMVTIYEGGSNYWFNVAPEDIKEIRTYFADHVDVEGASLAEKMAKYLWDGHKITIIDTEDPEEILGELTLENINDAMNNPELSEYSQEFWDEDYDVVATDILVQHALFGEVVYG